MILPNTKMQIGSSQYASKRHGYQRLYDYGHKKQDSKRERTWVHVARIRASWSRHNTTVDCKHTTEKGIEEICTVRFKQ